jgi:DNA-binding transcriptional LysR family regulator
VPVHWDDFRFVLALRRAGSLGAAARLLKVEQSTASRRLAALEAELGVQLVTRTPEGVTLNAAGTLAADLAETMDHGIEDLVRRVGGEDLRPEGVVRVATTDATAGFLMSGLVPLRDAYPKIRIELLVGNGSHDLLRREADIAVRMFRETSPTLVARKLGDLGWSLFASPDYVARANLSLPLMPCAAALDGHAIIGFNEELARSPGGAWLAANSQPDQVVLRAGTVASVVNAVKNGLGIAVAPCFAVHAMPSVVRLTPDIVASGEAFLVTPPHHGDTARVRIVKDAIIALFTAEHAVLAGTTPSSKTA